MKITKICKYISVVTVFAFITTQVVPMGLAIDPVTLSKADAEQVPTQAVGETVDPAAGAAKIPVTPVAAAVPSGTMDFLMGTLPAPTVTSSNTSGAAKSAPASTVAAADTKTASADAEAQATGITTQTTDTNTQTTDLPVAPPLGLTNTDKPATLFYTESDWAETMREWGVTIINAPQVFANLLKDVATSIRKFAGDVWDAFKRSITLIAAVPFGTGAWITGTTVQISNHEMNHYSPTDRFRLMNLIIHEAFHRIGKNLDQSLGFTSADGLGAWDNETSTDARSFKSLERIANNSSNDRGWREVFGNERSNGDSVHYFISQTVKNEAYTVTSNDSTGERTVTRFTIGNFDWAKFGPLSGWDYLLRKNGQFMDNMMSFSGKQEVYRADNTLARIVQYEKSGKGVRPGDTNRIASIAYYDAAGTAVVSREEYTAYAAGDRYQMTLKNAAGEVLSSKWYQVRNGVAEIIPDDWNVPTNIIPSAPTATGVVTLSGKKASGTSIWYSIDGGITYKQLASASDSEGWKGKITLPSGVTTISIISRIAATVAGVLTTISSAPAVLDPITYTGTTTVIVPLNRTRRPFPSGVAAATASNPLIGYSTDSDDSDVKKTGARKQ